MDFSWRDNPWRTLYIYYWKITTFLIREPYWRITSLVPSWRPRKSWDITRSLFTKRINSYNGMRFMTTPDTTFVDVDSHAKEPSKFGFKLTNYFCQLGTASTSSPFITELLQQSGTMKRAFAVDYRLSSGTPFVTNNPFPAALLDALAGYKYLVDTIGFKSENIIIEGDSAGGHLAINLVSYLNDAAIRDLHRPGRLILVSPSADWAGTHDGPGSSLEQNKDSDFVYHFLKSGYSARALLGALPPEMLRSGWFSPGSKDLENAKQYLSSFPQTYMLVGGAEVALDAMRTLRHRIEEENGLSTLRYVEYPDAIHVFPLIPWHEPERSEAAQACIRWLNE
ncbi:hypothetical protein M422DRAFT_148502 [Sphaerobolus stellatus SS14]|nr:hypothetical protein M422DRAFT_148502 [Sphaerobolus stellatus SS14]